MAFAENAIKYPKNHWKIFTKNLVVALKSDNDGLKQAAMVQIIRYKDKLNLSKTIFPMVDIYEKNSNEKIRELATTALFYTENKWGENYLRENFENEKNPQIKHLILSYIQAEKKTDKYMVLEDNLESILANNTR